MTSSDRFLAPVRSSVKLNFIAGAAKAYPPVLLNELTVRASVTELGKLFHILTRRACREKNAFVSHNEKNDYTEYKPFLRQTFGRYALDVSVAYCLMIQVPV